MKLNCRDLERRDRFRVSELSPEGWVLGGQREDAYGKLKNIVRYPWLLANDRIRKNDE